MAKNATKAAGASAASAAADTAATQAGQAEGTQTTELHFSDMVYDRDVFTAIVVGTNSEAGGAIVNLEAANKLAELGLVEVNPATISDGNIAARLTDKGREADTWNRSEEGQAAQKKTRKPRVMSSIKTPTEFTISDDDIPIPEARRGGGGRSGETYPFGKLAKGKSFHIPTTAETQDVLAARLTSSVSTANSRYEDFEHPVDGAKGARFISRTVGADDRDGIGIRVWREKTDKPKAPDAPAQAEPQAPVFPAE